MKVTIIGAGKAGHAATADMVKKGFQTSLWARSIEKIEALKKQGKIHVDGLFTGNFKPDKITNDLADALNDADLISLMVTSDAYEDIARKMAPHLVDGQKILLNCAGVGGSLIFHLAIRNAGYKPDITIGETDNCIYGCKSPRVGSSLIKSIKNKVYLAVVPLNRGNEYLHFIKKVYPQFSLIKDPLAVGFWKITCLHTAGMILNAKRILNHEDFNFYTEGITPEIANYMEHLDEERISVCSDLGLPTESATQRLHSAYGVPMSSLYTMLQHTQPYSHNAPAPKTFQHRYLTEEVPTKLIPRLEIGEILGVPVPLTTEIINQACELTGLNLYANGRSLEKLRLTQDDILNYPSEGIYPYLLRHTLC